MKFDFSWFTTVQGMLISCGVLLLFAALIVFIVSSVKKKKEKNPLDDGSQGNGMAMPQNASDNVGMSNNVSVPADNSLISQYSNPTVEPQQNVVPSIGTVTPSPVVGNTVPEQSIMSQQVMPAVEPVMPQQMAPAVEPVMPERVMPAVEPVMPAVEPVMPQQVAPVVEPVMPQQVAPVIEPVMPQQVAPVVEPVMPQQVIPTVEPAMPQQVAPVIESVVPEQMMAPQSNASIPAIEPAPVIYGGANPSVGNIDFNQNASHQIYGGANPLDNTQPISIGEVPNVQPVINNDPTIVQPQPVTFNSNETL